MILSSEDDMADAFTSVGASRGSAFEGTLEFYAVIKNILVLNKQIRVFKKIILINPVL